MNERSEGQGAISVVLVVLVLLLLLAGGGCFVAFTWQRTMVQRERDMARVAEMEARRFAELARAEAVRAQQQSEASASFAAAQANAIAAESDSAGSAELATTAITTLLTAQANAWNEGDLDSFMEHYWHSDGLTFSSTGKTTRGWFDTMNRYRTKYPSREAMGTLKFDALEITLLGSAAALVLGRWHLARADEPLEGNFSLVLRRLEDRWTIIHDHTSLLPVSELTEDR